jgi:hypothetical protein
MPVDKDQEVPGSIGPLDLMTRRTILRTVRPMCRERGDASMLPYSYESSLGSRSVATNARKLWHVLVA